MMKEYYDPINKEQAEILAWAAEELGESVQAICKILRHGMTIRWPPETGPSNQETLEKELGDVQAAIKLLIGFGIVRPDMMEFACTEKLGSVWQWLHHAKPEDMKIHTH